MGLQKGQTNNLRGRPKGSKNRQLEAFREKIISYLDGYDMQADLNNMEPEKRAATMLKLLEFVLPKLRSVEMEQHEKEDTKITVRYKNFNESG